MTTTLVASTLKVADETWIALAELHRENPDRAAFSAREILDKVKAESLYPSLRAGIQPHISLHNVANLPANSARYRMFYRTANGHYRLFLPGDDFHPTRTGKVKPQPGDLPERYVALLDWYEQSYCKQSRGAPAPDPFLAMRSVGKELWAGIDTDWYVEDLRSGWDPTDLPGRADLPGRMDRAKTGRVAADVKGTVWTRLGLHQGEEFKTKTGLPFTYSLEGSNGIWFFRNGRRIEQRLARTELDKALRELPLSGPTDIKQLRDPSYLYGLLADPRIVGAGD
jgi:hypothetical protein